jgi:hypothetical protein
MKNALNFLRNYEPARLAGIRTALFGLAASIGLTISPAMDAKTGALVAGATAVLTLIQSVLTRRNVYAPGSVDQLVQHAIESRQDTDAPVIEDPLGGFDNSGGDVPEGAGG